MGAKTLLPYMEWRNLGDGRKNLKIFFMIPGEYLLAANGIEINAGRKKSIISVVNTGDRPVQIGSHFHFFEINKQMKFDREKAFGMRLNIAAGTAIRFEPGEEKEVELVEFGGQKIITGFNNLTNGKLSLATCKDKALVKVQLNQFKNDTA